MSDGLDALRVELARAAASLGAPAGTEVLLERPRDPSFGDWATNLAMVLAKPLGQKPRDLAQRIVTSRSVPVIRIVFSPTDSMSMFDSTGIVFFFSTTP